MSEQIAVNWSVDDGYVNNGTHTAKIDIQDFDADMTDDEILDVVSECVQSDFEQKAMPGFDLQEAIEAVRAALAAGKDER